MSKFIRTQALVLRRTNYGEADRILSLLTPDGQVSAIARGVRKTKSKLAGAIELFCLSDVVLVRGKTELLTLSSGKLLEQFDQIIKDYDRLNFAYTVLKQVERASRDISGGSWFVLCLEVLSALNQSAYDFDLIQAWFYLRLSFELGEELNLSSDADGSALQSGQNYRYDAENRTLALDARGRISTNHLKLLRLMSTSSLKLCAQVNQVSDYSSELLLLTRAHASLR